MPTDRDVRAHTIYRLNRLANKVDANRRWLSAAIGLDGGHDRSTAEILCRFGQHHGMRREQRTLLQMLKHFDAVLDEVRSAA